MSGSLRGGIGDSSRLAFDLLYFFWSASQLISLTFRRIKEQLLHSTRFLRIIEALFARKVKKIPSGKNTVMPIDSNSVIIVVVVCYNPLKQNSTSKESFSL
jgi:hypothetical protein